MILKVKLSTPHSGKNIAPTERKVGLEPLTEDYYIVQILPLLRDAGALTSAELIADHGPAIAQIVRGETSPLSNDETAEVLHSRLSYFPNDLLVAGWTAAVVYDTAESSAPTIQLLEYANSQLLEFRHYDHVLTLLLSEVYDVVSRASGQDAATGILDFRGCVRHKNMDAKQGRNADTPRTWPLTTGWATPFGSPNESDYPTQ